MAKKSNTARRAATQSQPVPSVAEVVAAPAAAGNGTQSDPAPDVTPADGSMSSASSGESQPEADQANQQAEGGKVDGEPGPEAEVAGQGIESGYSNAPDQPPAAPIEPVSAVIPAAFPRRVTLRNHGTLSVCEPATRAYLPPGGSTSVTVSDLDQAVRILQNVNSISQRGAARQRLQVVGLDDIDLATKDSA